MVFSTWRLTLDVVQQGLNEASLPSIRFDGKVPQKERQSVVNRFKQDPSIRVMLLTLSCGAVGYVPCFPSSLFEAGAKTNLLQAHANGCVSRLFDGASLVSAHNTQVFNPLTAQEPDA